MDLRSPLRGVGWLASRRYRSSAALIPCAAQPNPTAPLIHARHTKPRRDGNSNPMSHASDSHDPVRRVRALLRVCRPDTTRHLALPLESGTPSTTHLLFWTLRRRVAPVVIDEAAESCYCVCHSSYSSRAWCEHCQGDNDVNRVPRCTVPDKSNAFGTCARALPCPVHVGKS